MSINPADLRFVKAGERPRARDWNALVRVGRQLTQFGGDDQCIVTSNGRYCRTNRAAKCSLIEGRLSSVLNPVMSQFGGEISHVINTVNNAGIAGQGWLSVLFGPPAYIGVRDHLGHWLYAGEKVRIASNAVLEGEYTVKAVPNSGFSQIFVEEAFPSATVTGVVKTRGYGIKEVQSGPGGVFEFRYDLTSVALPGNKVTVTHSSGNNGTYTIASAEYEIVQNNWGDVNRTGITVVETVPDNSLGLLKLATYTTATMEVWDGVAGDFSPTGGEVDIVCRQLGVSGRVGQYVIAQRMPNDELRPIWIDCD